jgi:hypothetical protein
MPDTGGMTGYGEEMDPQADPRQTPPGDVAEKMASDEIQSRGVQFEGQQSPTQADIDQLRETPTDSVVEAFDEKFGDGAAAKYMNEGGASEEEPSDGKPY